MKSQVVSGRKSTVQLLVWITKEIFSKDPQACSANMVNKCLRFIQVIDSFLVDRSTSLWLGLTDFNIFKTKV